MDTERGLSRLEEKKKNKGGIKMLLILFTFIIVVILTLATITTEYITNLLQKTKKKKIIKIFRKGEVLPYKEGKHWKVKNFNEEAYSSLILKNLMQKVRKKEYGASKTLKRKRNNL